MSLSSDLQKMVNKVLGLKNFLVGGTDGTVIGNTSGRLNVDAQISSLPTPTSTDQAQIYSDSNKLYSVGVDINMATQNVDNPLILFRNPTGSGKKIFIWKVQCGCNTVTTSGEFKILSTPTVTSNGGAVTYYPRNINNSQPAGVALVNSLPTVSAMGNPLSHLTMGQNSEPVVFIENFSLCLQPNSAILITGNPSNNNKTAVLTVIWSEVSL